MNFRDLPKALRDHRNSLETLSKAFGEGLRIETLDGKKYRLRSEKHAFSDYVSAPVLAGTIAGMVRAANIFRNDAAQTAAQLAWKNGDAADEFLKAQPGMADSIARAWVLDDPAEVAALLVEQGCTSAITEALLGTGEAMTVVAGLLTEARVEDALALVLAEATPQQTANALGQGLTDLFDAAGLVAPLPDQLEDALRLRRCGRKAQGAAVLSQWYDDNF